jgi:demethylmenaquinone methyltransferase/2-methoxy-6-polyprenyl-1,4-benzoquinol methylase
MADASPTDAVIRQLLEAEPLRGPLLRSIVESLDLPAGSRGLDAGCGIGLQSLLLAQAVGPGGRVAGVDINPEIISHAENLAREAGLDGRITYKQGSITDLPFPDGSFDWVWSADCAGYPHGDMPAILQEFKRVLKPGGRVFILAWSSQQILPGYPLLEARLNADCSSYQPYLAGKDPEGHFQRALRWFTRAGLENARGQTFVSDVQAPLRPEIRTALASLIGMLWDVERLAGLTPLEQANFLRLCKPDSPDCILDSPGYYAFFTYTLFQGKTPVA